MAVSTGVSDPGNKLLDLVSSKPGSRLVTQRPHL